MTRKLSWVGTRLRIRDCKPHTSTYCLRMVLTSMQAIISGCETTADVLNVSTLIQSSGS